MTEKTIPLYVKLGLWMVPSRRAALAYMWGSAAFALASAGAGLLIDPFFFFGLGLLASAAWYWAAIQWTDKFGTWASPQ
jgi:hypothetical protein